MALTTQKLGKFFSLDDLGDRKTLERWQIRLSNLPDDPEYIDSLFEPFYEHSKMPEPSDLMQEHWRKADPSMLSDYEAGRVHRQLTWTEVDKVAKSLYSKGVLALLYRRFGVPIKPRREQKYFIISKKQHEQPLNQEEFISELKQLGKIHNVPWQGME